MAKIIVESHREGEVAADVSISGVLSKLGWALTLIKLQVTEQQDSLLDASKRSSEGVVAKEEAITVDELLDLTNGMALDHFSHVYIE